MTKTPKRRTPRASARKLPLPTPYTHADGRPGYLVATSNGPPLSMPASYWETVKRHGVPNAFRWNGDHKNKEQHGEKGIAYVRVCCKEPGRRGKNNKPSTRTALRVIVQCLFRDAGMFMPDDLEVHFLTEDRGNGWPENWEIRSRYDNKKFVDAVMGRHPDINWKEIK
jgi:hypothetical protein